MSRSGELPPESRVGGLPVPPVCTCAREPLDDPCLVVPGLPAPITSRTDVRGERRFARDEVVLEWNGEPVRLDGRRIVARATRGRGVLHAIGDGVRLTARLAPVPDESPFTLGPLPPGRYRVVLGASEAPSAAQGVQVDLSRGTTDMGLLPPGRE